MLDCAGDKMKEFAKGFYQSAAWMKLRKAYFVSRLGICERCGRAGLIVHHKIYLNATNIHDTSISLDWNNLELLCLACHNAEHGYFTKCEADRVFVFDACGNIVDVIDNTDNTDNTDKK